MFPYTPGLDVAAMDRTADPCMTSTSTAAGDGSRPIRFPRPGEVSVYGKLTQDNQRYPWAPQEPRRRPRARREQQKSGDYFAACMDEAAVGSWRAAAEAAFRS
jgi:endothelin-converting enzyme/putative endopeptidase